MKLNTLRIKHIMLDKNMSRADLAEAAKISYQRTSIWDCVTLKECKEIVTVGSHWTDLFENVLTRPEEVKISGGKAAKTKWIEQIEVLQNKLRKPSYSVSTAEFNFINAIYDWISI